MHSTPSSTAAASNSIASLPLFKGMESDLLQGLIASSRMMQHNKGDVFLAQGQAVSRFYIVLDGWCGASKGNSEGKESILQLFRHGDFLPEPGQAATMQASLVNLQALTEVQLLMLTPSIVRNALERSPVFAANMLAASIRRCDELRDHIEQLTLQSAEQRVGRFLLQMRFVTGEEGKDVVLPFDKSFIATYLGIKPETFSRTLQSFKDKGFVVEKNHLVVPTRQALCDYCDAMTMQSCHKAHTDECFPPANGDTLLS